MVCAFIATAFAQPDRATAKTPRRLAAERMRAKLPKLAAPMDGAEEDVLACMTVPAEHRAKLRSMNPIEPLNGNIKRHTDAVGIFPSEAFALGQAFDTIDWATGELARDQDRHVLVIHGSTNGSGPRGISAARNDPRRDVDPRAVFRKAG